MKNVKLSAFTLAEVLITLGIIGVVATMTIPTLINNYQKKQYVSSLQKAYTQFNQVLIKLAEENGCAGDLACTGLFENDENSEILGKEIAKHFKVLKDCGVEANAGCFASTLKTNYDGTGSDSVDYDASVTRYKFITVDGISYRLGNYNNNNCNNSWSTGVTGHMKKTCGIVLIDVNGPKKGPNYLGRDIFNFFITNGNGPLLYPDGGADSNYNGTNNWWKNPSTNEPRWCLPGAMGWRCAGRVMEEGWEMNY